MHDATDDLMASPLLRSSILRKAGKESWNARTVSRPARRSWAYLLSAVGVVMVLVISAFFMRAQPGPTVGFGESDSMSRTTIPRALEPASKQSNGSSAVETFSTPSWTSADCVAAVAIVPRVLSASDQILDLIACIDTPATPVTLSRAQRTTILAALKLPDVYDNSGVWCSDPAMPPVTVIVRLSSGQIRKPVLPRLKPNCFVPVRTVSSILKEIWADSYLGKQPSASVGNSDESSAHLSVGILSTDQPIHNPCKSAVRDAKGGETVDELVVCRGGASGIMAYVPTPRYQSGNLAALALKDESRPRAVNDGSAQGCTDPALQIRYVAKLSSGGWVNVIQPREHGGCLVPVAQVMAFNRMWIAQIPRK